MLWEEQVEKLNIHKIEFNVIIRQDLTPGREERLNQA